MLPAEFAALSDFSGQFGASYFEHICDSLSFALIATDDRLCIRFCNTTAGRMFAAPTEAVIGRPVLEVFPEDVRATARPILERVLRECAPGEFEFPQRDPASGRLMFLVAVISYIPASADAPHGVSVAMRDITQRRELARQLSRARRMTALGNMAGGVAHHFNGLLGGVTMRLEVLLKQMSPRDRLRKDLEQVAAAIGHAARISGQLLTFAEGDHEAGHLRDLTEVVTTCAEEMRRELTETNVRVESMIEPIPPTHVESRRLRAVLDSLKRNSLEAMPDGGVIRLSLCEADGMAQVRFEDSGQGIPESKLEKIFEPFYTTKGELGGGAGKNTGLGLAVVHSFVEDMGGRIDVESTLGKGTTFLIRLPLGSEHLSRRRRMME